jgi:DNA adenine methylase
VPCWIYNPRVAEPTVPRPFLKWAGGKRQLLPALRCFYPVDIERYFEPFVGTGAVFFDLWNSGRLAGREVRLTDANADLIGCYRQVRDRLDDVIAALEELARGHASGGQAHYYEIRDAVFNPARDQWRDKGGRATHYTPALAAMLIYLNRTGYNGLFRQNARGQLNVPAGDYARPRIVDAKLLEAVSVVLRTPGVHVEEVAFERIEALAGAGDFAYFDPPYAPLSRTAGFRSYTAGGFSDLDQQRLHDTVVTLAERGTRVLLSNSTAPVVVRLYEGAAFRRAGLKCWRVAARRAINSRADLRGAVEELIATNVPPSRHPMADVIARRGRRGSVAEVKPGRAVLRSAP